MTKKRITYTHVVLYKKDYPSDTIKKDSMAKVDQLQTIYWKNLGRKLGELNEKDKAKLDDPLLLRRQQPFEFLLPTS